MRRVKLLCSLIMLLASQGAQAVSYPLPPEGSRLVGSPLTVTVPPGNTKPLEAFACGSASTTSTDFSRVASDAARLTDVVVLPTPPF